jgi:integrase
MFEIFPSSTQCHLSAKQKVTTMKLTTATIRRLSLPAGKSEAIFFDDKLPGFGLRLRSGGSATWVFQFKVGGEQGRMIIGSAKALTPEQARDGYTGKDKDGREIKIVGACHYHAMVREGRNPQHEKSAAEARSKARAAETFEACLKTYLEMRRRDVKLRPRSYVEIERHLLRNLKPLHGLQLVEIERNRRIIAGELARLTSENGPTEANRTHTSLSRFLNWCIGQGVIDANPTRFVNKNSEVSRERVLVDSELKEIWRALPDNDFGDVLRLLLLTGQRKREIGALEWSEVDLDRKVITLPSARTKNRKRHTVPLSDPAAAILEARAAHSTRRKWVFGRTSQTGMGGWNQGKRALDKKLTIPPWVIHDFRRACATGMANIGVQPHVIEAVLNHVSGSKAGVAGTYNRSTYEPEKRQALDTWATYLVETLVSGRPAKVVALRSA